MFDQLGIPIEGLGDGFNVKSQDLEHSARLARSGWVRAEATIRAGAHFLVVLDENHDGAGVPAQRGIEDR